MLAPSWVPDGSQQADLGDRGGVRSALLLGRRSPPTCSQGLSSVKALAEEVTLYRHPLLPTPGHQGPCGGEGKSARPGGRTEAWSKEGTGDLQPQTRGFPGAGSSGVPKP